MNKNDIYSILSRGIKALQIHISEDSLHMYEQYYAEVLRFSKAYSLTSLKTPEEFAVKGILDSLLYLYFIPDRPGLSLLDVGSGAGLPALVVKIARPHIRVTLVEPSRKKATFVRHIINKLSLKDTEVFQDSIEGFAAHTEQKYTVATTRALFHIRDFLKKVGPLVHSGGLLIVSKGPNFKEELRGLTPKELKKHNASVQVREVPLPLTSRKRFFIIIQINDTRQ